jgi:hypothetical protein
MHACGSLGPVHLNPAVTLAIFATGRGSIVRVLACVAGQLVGGCLAGLFVMWLLAGEGTAMGMPVGSFTKTDAVKTVVVEALLAAGADFRTPLATGFTPLLFAVRAGHLEIVSAFLKAGVDVNAATEPTMKLTRKHPRKGSSALTVAVENGHFELAGFLLDAGANPNDLRSGFAPLHILTWIRKPPSGEDEGDPIPMTWIHVSLDLENES